MRRPSKGGSKWASLKGRWKKTWWRPFSFPPKQTQKPKEVWKTQLHVGPGEPDSNPTTQVPTIAWTELRVLDMVQKVMMVGAGILQWLPDKSQLAPRGPSYPYLVARSKPGLIQLMGNGVNGQDKSQSNTYSPDYSLFEWMRQKSPDVLSATKMVCSKVYKFRNSGSESITNPHKPKRNKPVKFHVSRLEGTP